MEQQGERSQPTVLTFARLTATPWRNGGGITRDVAVAADRTWRLSIASLQQSGPFSLFPGLDRVFLAASAGGVTLHVEGVPHEVGFGEQLAFPGEATVVADLPSGGGHAINLMTRRGSVVGKLRVSSVAGVLDVPPSGVQAVVVLTGDVLADRSRLAPLDCVLDWSPAVELRGDGTVVFVVITASPPPLHRGAG